MGASAPPALTYPHGDRLTHAVGAVARCTSVGLLCAHPAPASSLGLFPPSGCALDNLPFWGQGPAPGKPVAYTWKGPR